MRRVSLIDLQANQTLAWEIFNAKGDLVWGRGQILPDLENLRILLEQGLFTPATLNNGSAEGAAQNPDESPSVLRLINHNNKQLEKLLPILGGRLDAESELNEITHNLIQALAIDTDVALACIFLNQIGGIYAVRHCIETAIVALLIAQAQGKTMRELSTIGKICLTMNVGMLNFHEQLQDRRSILSAEEQRSIERHPEQSVNILRQAGIEDEEWMNGILHHHENDDGSGYPFGKSRAEIPEQARLVSIADRYCAQVSARNYRKSITPDLAAKSLGLPVASDDGLHQLFMQEIGLYPPGTLVQLENLEIGVVHARQAHAAPSAYALLGPAGKLATPEKRNCAQEKYRIQRALHEDEVNLRIGMKQIWGAHAAL